MSKGKNKEPHVVEQGETEDLHPQITRTKYSDLMSEQTVVTVTIPPLGIMEPGFHEALQSDLIKGDRPLNSWADIQELIGFAELEAVAELHPKKQGHHGPVQLPERFSEEEYRRHAYQLIKQALDAIADLSEENDKDVVLNNVASRFLKAGMALSEARLRVNHYDDVTVRRRVRKGLRQLSAAEAEKQKEELDKVIKSMKNYIERGISISNAARLSHEKGGYGASPEANRRLYYRRGGKTKL